MTNDGVVTYDLGSSPNSGLQAANNGLTTKFRLAGGSIVSESLFTAAGITTERISEPNLSGNNYLGQIKKSLLSSSASEDDAVTASVTIEELQQAPDCPVDRQKTELFHIH